MSRFAHPTTNDDYAAKRSTQSSMTS